MGARGLGLGKFRVSSFGFREGITRHFSKLETRDPQPNFFSERIDGGAGSAGDLGEGTEARGVGQKLAERGQGAGAAERVHHVGQISGKRLIGGVADGPKAEPGDVKGVTHGGDGGGFHVNGVSGGLLAESRFFNRGGDEMVGGEEDRPGSKRRH